MEIKEKVEVFGPHTPEFWEDVILGPVTVKAAFEPIGGEDDVEGVGDEKLGNNGESEINGENNDID